MKFAFDGKHTHVVTSYIRTENGQWQFQSYWETAAAIATHEDLKTHASSFAVEISGKWAALAPASATFVGCRLVHYTGGTELDAWASVNAPGEIVDAEGELAMPDTIALVIQRRTANTERHKRGRMFIPGIAEDVNDNGRVSETFLSDASQLANVFGASHTSGAVEFNARHWDRKTPDATVVTYCRVMSNLAIRKSRSIRFANLPAAG